MNPAWQPIASAPRPFSAPPRPPRLHLFMPQYAPVFRGLAKGTHGNRIAGRNKCKTNPPRGKRLLIRYPAASCSRRGCPKMSGNPKLPRIRQRHTRRRKNEPISRVMFPRRRARSDVNERNARVSPQPVGPARIAPHLPRPMPPAQGPGWPFRRSGSSAASARGACPRTGGSGG